MRLSSYAQIFKFWNPYLILAAGLTILSGSTCQSQALVKNQAVFEELIQAPEVARRHLEGYSFEYYQNDIIQLRKALLDNYVAEDDHLLWGTEYTYAQAQPQGVPPGEERRDEPYFSGAHPEYGRYKNYTNALHVAAQYAFLFTQDVYNGQNVAINANLKPANEWATEIARKVLKDLYETVTDDDLDIWNGTYRNNSTWGTSTRYVKGVHFRTVNPYFVSVSKASAMWDSFALISQILENDPVFLEQQTVIYDWLNELAEYVEAALDYEFQYYVPDWQSFGNYEANFRNGSITSLSGGAQNHYYFDVQGGLLSNKIHASADVGNNRNMGHLEYLAKTATYAENATLKSKVKDYLRRVYEVATSIEGGNVDIQRNNGPGFTELNYTWIALSEIVMIAQHYANYTLNGGNANGWDEFYALTHAEGVEDRYPSLDKTFATANPNKNIKLMLDYQAGFLNNNSRYGFDGELFSMDNGTGTIQWRSFQMFNGNESSINSYLDSFNGSTNYTTSLWGDNEGLMAWHKWETVFGGPYSMVDFPNLYPRAAEERGGTTNSGDGEDENNEDDGGGEENNDGDGSPNEDDDGENEDIPDDEESIENEGVEEITNQIVLYPNPAVGETVSIMASEFRNSSMGISVYDISGKRLLAKQKTTDDSGKMVLEIGFLVAGFYVLNIHDLEKGGVVASKKMLKN